MKENLIVSTKDGRTLSLASLFGDAVAGKRSKPPSRPQAMVSASTFTSWLAVSMVVNF